MNEVSFIMISAIGLYLLLVGIGLLWCQVKASTATEMVIGDSLVMILLSVILFPLFFLIIARVDEWLMSRTDEHANHAV